MKLSKLKESVPDILKTKSDFNKIRVIWVFNNPVSYENSMRELKFGNSASFKISQLLGIMVKNGVLETDLSDKDLPLVTMDATELDSLTSLKGFPRTINSIDYSNRWSVSLEGFCQNVENTVKIESLRLNTLSGIGKRYIRRAEEVYIDAPITSSILGILLIKNLKGFGLRNTYESTHNLRNAVNILEKHFQGDRDVLECQEELIKAGLKEFAKL